MIPNITENPRNRKRTKRGRKRFFNAAIHALRTRVDRTFAWEDKFKRLLLRFERIQQRHYGMKLMAYTLIIEICISNKNFHGGEGNSEARMNERNLAWERRTRRVLACKLRRMSRVLRGRLFAVWPLKSFQSGSTGLSSGA